MIPPRPWSIIRHAKFVSVIDAEERVVFGCKAGDHRSQDALDLCVRLANAEPSTSALRGLDWVAKQAGADLECCEPGDLSPRQEQDVAIGAPVDSRATRRPGAVVTATIARLTLRSARIQALAAEWIAEDEVRLLGDRPSGAVFTGTYKIVAIPLARGNANS